MQLDEGEGWRVQPYETGLGICYMDCEMILFSRDH